MKRIVTLLAVCGVLLTLCACTDTATTPETTTTTTTTAPTTTTTTQSVRELYDYNAFTGEWNMEKGSTTRPIAFMVPNDSKTIGYQPNVDKADFYFECETEGGIPRMMTVFASASRIPDTYGPIRSARSPSIATARSLGAVLIHCGASSTGTATLKTGVLDHVDAIYESSTLFWRDPVLREKIDKVHSLVTGRDKLIARMAQKKFSTDLKQSLPFCFGNTQGTTTANQVQLHVTANKNYRVTFKYNAQTGLYEKNMGTIESNRPHTSLEGNQITVSNVLVLYAEKYVEGTSAGGTLYNFKTGSGKGYLMNGGKAREISFSRTDSSLVLQELDGTPLELAQGKTYMILADKTLSDKLILQ